MAATQFEANLRRLDSMKKPSPRASVKSPNAATVSASQNARGDASITSPRGAESSNRGSIRGSITAAALNDSIRSIEEDEKVNKTNVRDQIEISYHHIKKSRASSDLNKVDNLDKTTGVYKSLKTMEKIFQNNQVHKITHHFPKASKDEENAPCGVPLSDSKDPYCILELMYMPTVFKRKLLMTVFKALNCMKETDFMRTLI